VLYGDQGSMNVTPKQFSLFIGSNHLRKSTVVFYKDMYILKLSVDPSLAPGAWNRGMGRRCRHHPLLPAGRRRAPRHSRPLRGTKGFGQGGMRRRRTCAPPRDDVIRSCPGWLMLLRGREGAGWRGGCGSSCGGV
jgi:hypothetical protein